MGAVFCGLAFVAGGLTRWAGLICAFNFVVAVVMVHRPRMAYCSAGAGLFGICGSGNPREIQDSHRRFRLRGGRCATGDPLRHIPIFLSEPLEVVQSVFAPLLDLSRFKVNRHQELHRYENKCPNWCAACLSTGIVSELHMFPWILKCPFHLTPR